ncbi:MAG TPA: winged helix-turn-helix domain-containing protein, partial [Candidatus Acidoferrum sp.]|nr:winged helix-turn-helix domain-containing protein [Candidatus Acidoferrum sp.]
GSMQTKSTTNRRLYRFGLFEADLDLGTLTRQGLPVKLQEQPFRILALLLESSGEIVGREDLRKKIWPDGTYVEFDGSLNTALMKLRAALNDSADNPRFIETVPRKGYRFIAPAELAHVDAPSITTEIRIESQEQILDDPDAAIRRITPSSVPSERTHTESREKRRGFPWWPLLLVSGVIGMSIYGFWPRPEPYVMRVQQLSHSGQVDPWGKLVTDGSRIYFVVRDVTGWNLMQTSVEGGAVQRTPTPFDNTRIFDLSPNHSQFLIGQLTHRGEETPLWLWPVQGGAPRRLGDVIAQDAVWSPNGEQIAYVHGNSILLTDSQGLHSRELAKFQSAPHSLVWSPDGKRLRFTQANLLEGADSMLEVSLDQGRPRRVLPEGPRGPHEGSGTWLGDGKYFAFSSGVDLRASLAVDSQASLWIIDENRGFFSRHAREPIQLTRGPIAFDHPSALHDSSRIFAIGSHNEYQLLRIDPKTSAKTAMLAESGATDMDFSLDGQWVVYAARETGTLWKSRIDGSGKVQLTAGATGAFAPQWSPDQKQILFTGFLLDSQPRLYVVSAEGGSPRSVLPSNNKWASVSGDWRTDGKQIVLDVQEEESGKEPEIRILDIESGNLKKVPGSEGLVVPRWSADARYIAALNPDKKQVWLYDSKTQKWSIVAEAKFPSALRWSPNSDAIYFQDVDDVGESIFRVPLSTLKSERVLSLGDLLSLGATRGIFTGLSPDGSVYVTVDHGDVDVYAVDVKLP